MNKQINSINGYSCVQVQVKVQHDFSKRSACDVLTHAFYSPPTLKSCMKPCGAYPRVIEFLA